MIQRILLVAATAGCATLAGWVLSAPALPPIRDGVVYRALPPVTTRHVPLLRYLPGRRAAIALPGGRIFYRDSVPLDYVLAHEYAHAVQWERYGTAGFLRSYLRRAEPLENEARRSARLYCDELSDMVPPVICAFQPSKR